MEVKRQPHISLAHSYWEKIIQLGDWAIDATCGNGHDTKVLSELCHGVIGLDIQEISLQNTRRLFQPKTNVKLFLQSHETFPRLAYEVPIRLIVYNLGYLPGGNKNITTMVASTLQSLEEAYKIIPPDGMISITCYPGHSEGLLEQKAILEACGELPSAFWSVCHHEWLNRKFAPSLIIVKKL